MATVLKFLKNGRSVKAGLEVTIQWRGYNSWNPSGGGHSKYQTDSSGCVYVDESLINGHERGTDNIYIQNPDGGFPLKYSDHVIMKGAEHRLDLESAVKS